MKGYRFPDLDALERRLARLRWPREVLAERAGVTPATVGRILAGRSVSIESIERVTQAVVEAEPSATAQSLQVAS